MIIAYDTPGQLGNQLWAYTNLIAIAKEYNVSVYIILQSDYYIQLDETVLKAATTNKIFILNSASLKGKIIKRFTSFFTASNKKLIRKIILAILPVTIVNVINEKSKITLQKLFSILLVNSWECRVYKNSFIKQNEFIRNLISPQQKIKIVTEAHITSLRNKFDTLVAVHIRRGDYKEFLGGKYYFEDAIYLDKMKQFLTLENSKSICFYIFSNEDISIKNFDEISVYFNRGGSAISDMWAMSKCDYIIGPLSTFSMWASFWNKVPLQFITKNEMLSAISAFSPFVAQDLQEKYLAAFNFNYAE